MTQKKVTPERKAFLNRMEERIKNEIEQLLKYIEGFEGELRESSNGSGNVADRTNQAREVTKKLLAKSEGLLRQYKHALVRIKTGDTFGICCECSEAITDKRLESMPYILICIDCATSAESGCK